MITHVSFDLDGTLITGDYDTTLWNHAIPQFLAEQHHVPLALATEHVYAAYYKALYIDRIPHWTSIDHWLRTFHLHGKEQLLNSLRHRITLYDDAIPALAAAAREHTLLLFTANDDTLLRAKLDATDLAKYFTHTISATTYGTWKKDRNAYERLLTDLRLRPDELLHIGDDQHHDHDVPRSLGINTLRLDRKGGTPGSIRTLHEITEYLESALASHA